MAQGLGRYRHLATIFRRMEVSDGEDGLTTSEVTVCEPWIALVPLEGRELERHRQRDPRATHLVQMRYRDGIDARMFLRCKGRTFEVTSTPLNVEERNRELQLLVTETT